MVKIINVADPHVDATSVGGWDQERGIHSNWVESYKRLGQAAEAANDHKADFFVVDGDLFDTGKPTAEAVGLVTDIFRTLHKDCTLILLDGNHDQQTVVANHRTPIAAYFGDMDNVVAVSSPEIIEVNGMKFAAVPWLRVAGKSKVKNTSKQLQEVVETLSNKIGSGPSMFAAHIVVDECTFDNGMARGSEMNMATALLEAHIPTSVIDQGDWAIARLGHIHKRQQLSEKTGYAGSLYKVSFGEYREDKGYDIITIDEKNRATLEFGKLDVRNLIKIDLSREGDGSISDVDAVEPGDIVRFVVDYDDGDSLDVKHAKAKLDALGISNHVTRLPRPRREVAKRSPGAAVDTSPAAALEIYMDRNGITDPAEREAMIEELNLMMNVVGAK